MKTIILEQPGQLRLVRTTEPPKPGPDETLVRVRRIGVCGTDLHAFRGQQPFFTYPRILGHELGVEVIEVGKPEQPLREITPGMACAVEPYLHCGQCPTCLRGKTNCCHNLQVLGVHIDGGMREYILVPTKYLHPSPTLTFEQLALVEPLAIGAHAVERSQVTPGERVLIVGAGPIGLAVTQFALLAGAQVTVMDINRQRLASCQRFWPQVEGMLNEGEGLASLREKFGQDLPPIVFDATGNPQSMHTAFSYVGAGGRLIFVGLFQGDVTFNDPDFHRRELTIMSSRNATAGEFTRIIQHLEMGEINIDPWITHRATIDNVCETFPQWLNHNSGIIKATIAF